MSWKHEKQAILQWWPVTMGIAPNQNLTLLDDNQTSVSVHAPDIFQDTSPQHIIKCRVMLEDALWGAQTEHDWQIWLKFVECFLMGLIDRHTCEEQQNNILLQGSPTHEHKLDPLLYDLKKYLGAQPENFLIEQAKHILGPSLYHLLYSLLYYGKAPKLLFQPHTTYLIHGAQKQTQTQDIMHMVEKIKTEFSISSISFSQSSSPEWIKKQLYDAYMGFSQLSMLLNLSGEKIGKNLLHLWFHEKSSMNHSHAYADPFSSDIGEHHIEIHRKGGNLAQAWAYWNLLLHYNENSLFNPTHISQMWKLSWQKNHRHIIEHQFIFVEQSRLSFKKIIDRVDPNSEIGQSLFRRYRAALKWIDDIQRGYPHDVIYQNWIKIKTGNRIAWSAFDKKPEEDVPLTSEQIKQARLTKMLIQQWTAEEKMIETAFWLDPQWNVPSWIYRTQFLYAGSSKDYKKIEWSTIDDHQWMTLWALGFEGMIRDRIGNDSWLAETHLCQPVGFESQSFEVFFKDHLRELFSK